MTGCRPWKWLWGLIPLALIAFFVIVGVRKQIEYDLENRSALALENAKLRWALPSFEGRDGVLLGTVGDTAERDAALRVIRAVRGVRMVHDKAKLDLPPKVSPYTWRISLRGDRVKIKGHAPSKNDKRVILGMVKANLPEQEIDERMKQARGQPPRQVWLGAISFALQQMGRLKRGTARLDDTQFSLSGEARSAADYRALRAALETELPGGVRLKSNAVIPPVMKPFGWSAELQNASLTLMGSVPSEQLRAKVVEHARAEFARTAVIDKMELGAGAPEGWRLAVTGVLTELSRLVSGTVALSDVTLTVEGVAKDEATATDVARSIRNRLPAIFRSDETIEVQEPSARPDDKAGASEPEFIAPAETPLAAPVPTPTVAPAPPKAIPFVWTAIRNSEKLTLQGHVPSEEIRRTLIEAAREAFPEASVDDRMGLASGAPKGWSGVVRLALAQLRRLDSGQVRLTDRVLHVSGTAASPVQAATVEAALDAVLPETYKASKAIQVARQAAEPAPGSQGAIVGRCQSGIDKIVESNTIRFELGRAQLHRDSFQVLDDLAVLARRCPGTRIVVGGHTDSDGDTLDNLDLSRKRAEAVVAFLVGKGIARNRLMAIGYGDTRPVAPNDTPSNRARNRRIEFIVKLIR